MECSICYEKFLIPRNDKEFVKMYREIVKNNDLEEIMKFNNLILMPHYGNKIYTCSTNKCKCVICQDCFIKLTHNGKSILSVTDEDIPSIYDYFICPYCRNIDWKDYMKNVLNELQQKVLGKEIFMEMYIDKYFPQLSEENLNKRITLREYYSYEKFIDYFQL